MILFSHALYKEGKTRHVRSLMQAFEDRAALFAPKNTVGTMRLAIDTGA
ncbi:MAG: hypothetical protein GY915_08460 [bacterium]|nr:hypothetical protein [bacterium]